MPCRSRVSKPGFTEEDWTAFEAWQRCKWTGALPRAGGIEDQDPAMMTRFRIFFMFDEARGRGERDSSARALAAAFGAIAR